MTVALQVRRWLPWAAIVLLTVLPLWLAGSSAAFGGADERAQHAVATIAPHYQPWFAPVFMPASSEIASLLFALQAALGAGVIGFWLGLSMARERGERAQGAVAEPSPPLARAPHAD